MTPSNSVLRQAACRLDSTYLPFSELASNTLLYVHGTFPRRWPRYTVQRSHVIEDEKPASIVVLQHARVASFRSPNYTDKIKTQSRFSFYFLGALTRLQVQPDLPWDLRDQRVEQNRSHNPKHDPAHAFPNRILKPNVESPADGWHRR